MRGTRPSVVLPSFAPRMGMDLKRTLTVLLVALAAGLCLSACAEEGEKDVDDKPSLSAMKEFRAYPVYYSGTSVGGNALVEVFGDPSQFEDKRDAAWILIYGDCDAEDGGCFPPLSIHSYSTCARCGGPGRQIHRHPRRQGDRTVWRNQTSPGNLHRANDRDDRRRHQTPARLRRPSPPRGQPKETLPSSPPASSRFAAGRAALPRPTTRLMSPSRSLTAGELRRGGGYPCERFVPLARSSISAGRQTIPPGRQESRGTRPLYARTPTGASPPPPTSRPYPRNRPYRQRSRRPPPRSR